MKKIYQYLVLILPLLTHAADEQENFVRVTYRTLGWDIQGTFESPQAINDATFNVYVSQFSDFQTYVGPQDLQIVKKRVQYSSNSDSNMLDDGNEMPPPDDTDELNPPPLQKVLTNIRIPNGAKRVLLIFTRIKSANGKSNLRVAVVDDSLTLIDKRNVHFYNLTPKELIINAFDHTKVIQPNSQAIWQLKKHEDQSSLAIAIRDPEAKVIYSSRFRLRQDQRMVFFARKDLNAPLSNPDKLIVTALVERVQKEQQAVPAEVNQDISIN